MTEGLSESLGASEWRLGLEEDERARVLGRGGDRRLSVGEPLFHQGDPAQAFHLVVEGRVKLTQVGADGAEIIVRYVGPGEIVAGVVAFQDVPYPVSATAVEPTLVLSWEKSVVRQLCSELPQVGRNIMQVIGQRMRELQERFRELATQPVERRVASALLRLLEQSGRATAEASVIDHPLSRQDLAELTGTTLFTVSRKLSEWERQGIVRLGRQKVAIVDLAALRRLAHPDGT